MDVHEALATRYSARAFLPKPVERAVIEAVLRDAERTPSWANSQPWDIFVASGEALERIRAGFAAAYEQGVQVDPEVPRPTAWSETAKKCTLELVTVQRSEEYAEPFKDFVGLNRSFFNAPTVVFLCMDEVLGQWSLYDLGAYSQSLMLSATEQGLASIPAINLVLFPQIIREELQIPANLKIAIGVALGYADPDHGINSFRSSRRPFAEVVRFAE